MDTPCNASGVPQRAVPCRAGWAALTCGTGGAAPVSPLDPVHAGGAARSGSVPLRAGGRLHQHPLALQHDAVLGPQGLRFTHCQPQRGQEHLRAGSGQGCRQPGRPWSGVHTLGYWSQSGAWPGAARHPCRTGQNGWSCSPTCPGAAWVWGLGLGMPRGSPCAALSPLYPSRRFPAGTMRHRRRGSCCATPVPGGPPPGAPRVLCKWCARPMGCSATCPPPCHRGRGRWRRGPHWCSARGTDGQSGGAPAAEGLSCEVGFPGVYLSQRR